MSSLITTDSEWTPEIVHAYDKALGEIAAQEYHLDTYPIQIEVISAEQMIDAYASVGMPLGYSHWSFGKKFLQIEKQYQRGQMGLAYEMVINSNPCIAYLMEENSTTLQALVIAHACYGHNSFFKNNYLFKMWTNADAIVDYLVFSKQYIASCEERFGVSQVESLLDSCHALMNYGVDRYKHPPELSLREEKIRQQKRAQYLQTQVNELWRTIPKSTQAKHKKTKHFPPEPQENILYFLEKNAPLLKPWQREIIRIVRKLAQYFFPQQQTKVMNEGWACFWHYTLINALYEHDLVNEAFMLEVLQHHTNVIYQPPFDHPGFRGINPYTLGYGLFQDIRRICENPSQEDKEWFPHFAHSNWQETLTQAMCDFKDESFIAQYLSPQLIRNLKLFSILDDEAQPNLTVSAIHDEAGYQHIRESLSKQYDINYSEPNIQIAEVDIEGDRSMTLHHIQHHNRPLDESADEVLKHLHQLWQFPIRLHSINEKGDITKTYHCPLEEKIAVKDEKGKL